MSFDPTIHSLVDPEDENGWNTMHDDNDRSYERAESTDAPQTEAFYPNWKGDTE